MHCRTRQGEVGESLVHLVRGIVSEELFSSRNSGDQFCLCRLNLQLELIDRKRFIKEERFNGIVNDSVGVEQKQ